MTTPNPLRSAIEKILLQEVPGYSPKRINEVCDEIMPLIEREIAAARADEAEQERQFILNILDGIDIADKQMGVTGGTKAIRFALQSRPITHKSPPHDEDLRQTVALLAEADTDIVPPKCAKCGGTLYKGETYERDGKEFCSPECHLPPTL